MKTDPDFHPLAARWLDGQASASEQAVLHEILAEDAGAMAKFAALCRTEALLSTASARPAERRAALDSLLLEKPWPVRAADAWRRRRLPRRPAAAAAVALLGLGAWAVWQAGSGRGDTLAAKHSQTLSALRLPGGGAGSSAEDDADDDDEPNVDPELRRLLERMVLSDFKARGSLTEVVEGQFADLKTAGGKTLPVKVLEAGDEPVFLQFTAVMPAWHLLKLMALQTGTVLSMEDDALVFRRGEKRASFEDRLTRRTDLNSLRALLGFRAKGPDADVMDLYAAHTNMALGVNLGFEPDSADFLKVTGSSHALKLLKAAQTAALASPVRANLSVAMITVSGESLGGKSTALPSPAPPSPDALSANPLDMPVPEILDDLAKGRERPQLGGVLTAAQSRVVLSSMLRKPGMRFKALFDEPVSWNQENMALGVSLGKDGSTIRSEVSVIVKLLAGPTYDIDIASATDAVRPGGLGDDHLAMTTQVLVWDNQTAAIMGFRQPDGSELRFLVTASSMEAASGKSSDASRPGPDGQAAAHLTFQPDPAVSPPSTSTAPAAAEELAAIPVPGKPGFVTSPYSDLPVELDVSSLKHGSRFTCPLSGRKFRIP